MTTRKETPDILGEVMGGPPSLALPTVVPDGLNREDWREFGYRIGVANARMRFVIGDWILAANPDWGDMYREAAEITGLSDTYLRDSVYVSRAWQISSRDKNLSWSMHKTLAPIPDAEKAAAVQTVRENGYGVRSAREHFFPPAPADELAPGELDTMHAPGDELDIGAVEIIPTDVEIADVIAGRLKDAGALGDPDAELAHIHAVNQDRWVDIVRHVYPAAGHDAVAMALNRMRKSAKTKRQWRASVAELETADRAELEAQERKAAARRERQYAELKASFDANELAVADLDPVELETLADGVLADVDAAIETADAAIETAGAAYHIADDDVAELGRFLDASLPDFMPDAPPIARAIAALRELLAARLADQLDADAPLTVVHERIDFGELPDWRAGWGDADQVEVDALGESFMIDAITRPRVALYHIERGDDYELAAALVDRYKQLTIGD